MTTIEIILVIVGVLVVLGLAWLAWYFYRRQALRRRYGPEYDRLASEKDSVRSAEQELLAREERHAKLQLRELPAERRQEYAQQWQALQARFVESPAESIGEADDLVTRLLAEVGYPTGDYDEQAAMLSVEHARTLSDYRAAHDIAVRHEQDAADTEELRQAIVHYRTLVADILGTDPASPDGSADSTSLDGSSADRGAGPAARRSSDGTRRGTSARGNSSGAGRGTPAGGTGRGTPSPARERRSRHGS